MCVIDLTLLTGQSWEVDKLWVAVWGAWEIALYIQVVCFQKEKKTSGSPHGLVHTHELSAPNHHFGSSVTGIGSYLGTNEGQFFTSHSIVQGARASEQQSNFPAEISSGSLTEPISLLFSASLLLSLSVFISFCNPTLLLSFLCSSLF